MTSSQRRSICFPPWFVALVALTPVLAAVTGCSSKRDLAPEQQAQADMTAYEAQVRKIVTDPARADQLVALTNQFQQLVAESIASIKGYRAKIAGLNSNYDATRQDYEALFSEQDANRESFIKKASALREQMTALTTDSEWEELKKARLRALDAELEELLS
jgi:septal ring factor EnvC (AmiA/AmiB activator)